MSNTMRRRPTADENVFGQVMDHEKRLGDRGGKGSDRLLNAPLLNIIFLSGLIKLSEYVR
jgi:hypothetical protein